MKRWNAFGILAGLAVAMVVPVVMPAQTNPAATTTTSPGEDSMNRLLQPASNAGQPLQPMPVVTPPTAENRYGANNDAPATLLVREGTHITDRSGRLNHSADGQQAIFTFDSDKKVQKDPPLIILPNLKLMAMESAAIGASKDAHFRISGTITEYKNKNYILLDKAVIMADPDAQF